MSKIRLSEFEIDSIKSAFRKNFPSVLDHLWLFGSRIDLSSAGGDIDLYIETYEDEWSKIIDLKIKFLVALEEQLGERKIDIVINRLKSQKILPIYEEGRKGIQLL